MGKRGQPGERQQVSGGLGARTGGLVTEMETWKQKVRGGKGTEELRLRREERHRC